VKTFKTFKKRKLDDSEFKCLFDQECNVCHTTMKIFQKMERKNISIEELAGILDVRVQNILELKDADHCDAHLVIRICRHLNLELPISCPKL